MAKAQMLSSFTVLPVRGNAAVSWSDFMTKGRQSPSLCLSHITSQVFYSGSNPFFLFGIPAEGVAWAQPSKHARFFS